MKKILLFLLILLFVFNPVFAEDENQDGPIALGMGFGVGDFSMIGLQYQQWFGSHGIVVSAGLAEDQKCVLGGYEYCVYSTSFTEILNSRLYVWIEGGADYLKYSEYSSVTDRTVERSCVDAVAALGIGMEFIWWNHLSVPVQFGYVAKFPNRSGMSFYFSSGVRYRI